jgi:uncharacterized membrane protein HdeD (DUF308 family)
MIVRGVLAIAVGIIALAWPQVTVLALVYLFAVYAFIAAGLEAMRAFSSRKAGPVFGHLLLGLVDLAAGVIALVWPGPTALVLVLIVASWAVVTGCSRLPPLSAAARRPGHGRCSSWAGLASIAFGVVLFARPGVGAVTLALLFGLFNLIYGGWALAQGIELRHTQHSPEKRRPRAAHGLNHAGHGQVRRQVVLQQSPAGELLRARPYQRRQPRRMSPGRERQSPAGRPGRATISRSTFVCTGTR